MNKFTIDGTPDAIISRYTLLKEQAENSFYGELDEDIVVLDTETTGISFNHDELTQIAAARMKCGEITEWFVSFVNPGKPIPDEIVHLTKITNADVADAPSPEEVCAQLAEFVGDSYIVAHNSSFDEAFITKHQSGAALKKNIWVDSLDLARIALPRMKSHRLIDLVQAFDAPLSTHRADADVEALCAVYRILLAGVAAIPEKPLSVIASLAPVEEWPTGIVFRYFANDYNAARKTTAGEALEASKNEENESNIAYSNNGLQTGSQGALFISEGKVDESTAPVVFTRDDMKELRNKRIKFNFNKSHKVDARSIVEDPTIELSFPSAEEIAQAFSEEGLVGSLYDNYEQRDEQVEMAEAVRRSFETSTNLVVEAGTGVGKSLAYLLPAALFAQKNGVSVGVATKTNALLDQLVNKELPLLSKALAKHGKRELTWAPLKGFSRYVCLRQVMGLLQSGAQMKDVAGKLISQAPALAGTLSFIEQTEYDDIDAMKVDYRTLPRHLLTIQSNDCLRHKCPFYGQQCFVHGAREKASVSDIVVTNHSLLFCDVAADGGLLPTIRSWIIDEAHSAEQEARRVLSPEISAESLLRQGRILAASSGNSLMKRIEISAAHGGDNSTLIYALSAKAKSAGAQIAEAAQEFAAHFKDLLYFATTRNSKGYEYLDIWLNSDVRTSEHFETLVSYARVYNEAAEKFVKAGQELVASLEGVDGAAGAQRELASLLLEVKEIMDAVEIIFFLPRDAYAYAAHLSKKADNPYQDVIQALMINVGNALEQEFYSRTDNVIFASATLSIGDSFESFETAMGINSSESSRATSLRLPSSYDYDRNMTIFVVKDMPEPTTGNYLSELQELLIKTHVAQQGSMLTLFTNRKEMEQCFCAVSPALKAENLRLVCQKWGLSVKGLRDDFINDAHLSLFALKSFWEGFDAPGSTLRGVIIPRLPFGKPTDPLSCERAVRDTNAWYHYVLPAAIIETKQAAGRLIRGSQDRGVLIFADARLVSKGYGQMFLNSMPSRTVEFVTTKELVERLQEIWAKDFAETFGVYSVDDQDESQPPFSSGTR